MISRWKRDKQPTARLLSNQAIALGAVVVLGIGAAAWIVLLWRYGGAGPGVELDAIRTAGAITVAAGGAATLLLAARRQRSTEQTLEHQREVAQATERNAAEQRITELYTRAVDQLGAEKAPVRLGGLHALERLAQDNPTQRQTIVDVICAYLRMPYIPPDDHAPGEDASEEVHRRYEQSRQELQVRLTAQRILNAHLKPGAAAVFWADIDLNLTEAHLHQFDLMDCHVHRAQFYRATFAGDAYFAGATFARNAEFTGATFTEHASFTGATFAGLAGFEGATFAEYAEFDGATFVWDADFKGATFVGNVGFKEATFTGAHFVGATFARNAEFTGATFARSVWFAGLTFVKKAGLGVVVEYQDATFTGDTKFDGTRVAPSSPDVVLPTGWTTRAAQPAEGEEEGWLYVVHDDNSSEQPAEAPADRGGLSGGEAEHEA